MAKTDDRDDAFIREVDEEYRRSQVAGLWSRYGRALMIGIVVFLIALAALLYWREDRARRAGITGEHFSQALTRLEAGNAAGAAPVLADLATSGNAGYRALARLTQAATAVQSNDTPRALTIYRAVAADDTAAAPFRDLATIKATRLEFDQLPPATIVDRLKTLSVPGNPWFSVAAEMTGIAQMRAGKPALAAPLFAAIVRDPTAPPTLRTRAAQLAISLGVDPASLQPGRAPTETGTAR
ncbi:MAG: tetratricopeptide repeat protein [Janthinobacterium lividum]